MLRLTTFGGIVLREDGELHSGAASQRRRLALLAVIAASAGRPVSREKLLGYFWPESDTEHARHALRQSFHAIQRALGTDALFLGTDALQLNPAVISSDVHDVEEAVDQGVHQRVVGLMKGPFLDGFFANDAPELERWAEAQRSRYANIFIASLEALAIEASGRGDHTMAMVWWRRLTAEQPTSSRYVHGLIRALADAGDRTGALLQASAYEALVRDELDAEPDRAVADLAARLRTNIVSEPARQRRAPAAAAAAATLATARDRARDHQREWLERTLGDRLVVEAGVPSRGAIVAYRAYDRERQLPLEIHLIDPAVSVLADVDLLMARLDRIVGLRDPHLNPMYEYGNSDGVIYFTVARPLGESLRDKLEREHQLPVHDAVIIAADVAAALAPGHHAGVLHGDLRPKYIFVSDGRAVVTGVGIVDALSAATRNRTSTALRVGSPGYQSPEQLVGDVGLDQRSDVYSLGCILYEMLAGEVPFASQTPSTMVSGRLTSAVPSVAARRDTVSDALGAVVTRCLARAPSDRYRSAGEVSAALRRLVEEA